MVIKPEIGQQAWGSVLNAALDTLQGSADGARDVANGATAAVEALQGDVDALQGALGGKQYYRLVASATAPADVKAKANYVCTGSADQTQINTAITEAQAEGGGIVQLTGGSFTLSGPVGISGTVNEDDPRTVTLAGVGEFATLLKPAPGVHGISLTNWAQCHIRDLGIIISGSSNGIVSQGVTSGDTRSFWCSSFRNLRINGSYTPTNTGWGMYLDMPFRSAFDNIEIEGTRNGMMLYNNSAVQNAGDCSFTRMFIEIVGTGGTAIQVHSVDGNMNQNNFNMVEALADGPDCTGILIDGAEHGASQRFWGTNLEQFQTLVNVANGESNVFDLNYVTCRDGGAGNRAFVCGSNSYGNTFSAKWLNVSGAVKVIEDNNNTSNVPNVFDGIRIENNAGAVTYSKTNSTVFRNITTFNDGGTVQAGLLQYPLTVVNDPTFIPADQGLITWTHDPATLRSSSNATTSGTVYLCKVKIVERATVVSNIIIGVEAAGATLTSAQNLLGLYSASGTRLAVTADQSTAWTTVGVKTAAITPQTLAVGSYYVAILANGTTPPQFSMGAGGALNVNVPSVTGAARFLTGPTAQTSLPASITLSSQTQTTGARWAGLT
ncbi:hypothetical protein [Streptomyces paludis]|uniref:Pectate lyase superfamily protein domain-containing protein n=1 Tax=Streptomyces paludis TaxID=2282738 RepID=A0A345HWS0_9ACTN|nr:hypothetical protein [Streptomyces paludis]AXG81144.1 hypothetical protein DVK44_29530 [Streptomyces paludis]